jgi:hypothetical protein
VINTKIYVILTESCPQYGIYQKELANLKKPIKYEKITAAEWGFVKNI